MHLKDLSLAEERARQLEARVAGGETNKRAAEEKILWERRGNPPSGPDNTR